MFSITTSFFGVIMALHSHYTIAILCLLMSGICDAFDGKLARKYKYSKEAGVFGIQMDSLSDSFCFGAFPAILTCLIAPHPVVYILSAIYLLCGIIRLAYFNMLVSMDSSNSKSFIGVPITTVSVTYSVIFILLRLINYNLIRYIMPIVLIIQGISFIIRIKIPKYDFARLINKIISKVLNKHLINYLYFPLFIIIAGSLFFNIHNTGVSLFQQIGNIRSFLFAFVWISLLNGSLLLLFGNSKKSKIAVLVLTAIVLLINEIKYQIMGIPLQIADIHFLNPDNLKMAGEATTTFGKWIWFVVLKFLIYIVVGVLIIWLDKFNRQTIKKSWKRFCLSIVLFILFLIPLLSIKCFDRFAMKHIYKLSYDEVIQYSNAEQMFFDYGFYSGIVLDNASRVYYKPSGYDVDIAIKALKKAHNNKGELPKANVVFILSESLIDFPNVTDVKFNKSLTSNIERFKNIDNAQTFNLLVSSYGGISVNTEFQILSGASLSFWKASIIPYTQYYSKDNYEKSPNLIHEFNNNGYETMYLTPWGESSYSSKKVYKGLGADKTIYGNKLKCETKGDWCSDDSLVDNIYNELKTTSKGNYKFIFAASGQNHYPFTEDKYDEDEYDINIVSSNYSKEDNKLIRSYAQGVYDADKSFGKLYNMIQNLDVPTIVVFYGDHYPFMDNSKGEEVIKKFPYLNTDDEIIKQFRQYTTIGGIYSNFDADFSDLDYIGANYLGAYVLNKMDIKVSDYFKYIDQTRKDIPVFNRKAIYNVKDDTYTLISKASDKQKKAINTYKYVQYYSFYELGL